MAERIDQSGRGEQEDQEEQEGFYDGIQQAVPCAAPRIHDGNFKEGLRMEVALESVRRGEPCVLLNPHRQPLPQAFEVPATKISDERMAEAEQRWDNWREPLQRLFPELKESEGWIESPLQALPEDFFREKNELLIAPRGIDPAGGADSKYWIKLDSHLPVAGSVKARGGIFEVISFAENLARQQGWWREERGYGWFASPEAREKFADYAIGVGSTGNLGLSIGLMGSALGFAVTVYMSREAKQWKKDRLRDSGVEVLEFSGNYSQAVCQGRQQLHQNPKGYFVDDERSETLFLGYATAARRLQRQLYQQSIPVDSDHPLIVVIPAGVGGAPGGITFGLKKVFGESAICFFVETTPCPSVLGGIVTGKGEQFSVQELGLSGQTQADGLACPRPSGLVCDLLTPLVNGFVTVTDESLPIWQRKLYGAAKIYIEPSSATALGGISQLLNLDQKKLLRAAGLDPQRRKKATWIAWATGGRLVPEEEKRRQLS